MKKIPITKETTTKTNKTKTTTHSTTTKQKQQQTSDSNDLNWNKFYSKVSGSTPTTKLK